MHTAHCSHLTWRLGVKAPRSTSADAACGRRRAQRLARCSIEATTGACVGQSVAVHMCGAKLLPEAMRKTPGQQTHAGVAMVTEVVNVAVLATVVVVPSVTVTVSLWQRQGASHSQPLSSGVNHLAMPDNSLHQPMAKVHSSREADSNLVNDGRFCRDAERSISSRTKSDAGTTHICAHTHASAPTY